MKKAGWKSRLTLGLGLAVLGCVAETASEDSTAQILLSRQTEELFTITNAGEEVLHILPMWNSGNFLVRTDATEHELELLMRPGFSPSTRLVHPGDDSTCERAILTAFALPAPPDKLLPGETWKVRGDNEASAVRCMEGHSVEARLAFGQQDLK